MSIANGLALPNPLSNGTTADAVQTMGDFNYLLSALNRALLDAGGGAGMNAQATQIHNLANGTAANDAVNLSQISGLAALAGATFTGPVLGTAFTASGLITGNAGFSGTTLSLGGAANITGLITGGGGVISSGFLNVDTTVPISFSANRAGQVGYHLYNQGAIAEWLVYQPPHATDDKFHIGQMAAGVITDRLIIDTTGTLFIPGAVNLQGQLTPGSAANCVGYLGVPSTAKTANYQLALTDVGTAINMNGTSLTLTIPANSGTAIPIDSVIIVTNLNSSPLTIAITTDTLTISGTTSNGSRTLGQNGEARLRKVAATQWLITGTAMT